MLNKADWEGYCENQWCYVHGSAIMYGEKILMINRLDEPAEYTVPTVPEDGKILLEKSTWGNRMLTELFFTFAKIGLFTFGGG